MNARFRETDNRSDLALINHKVEKVNNESTHSCSTVSSTESAGTYKGLGTYSCISDIVIPNYHSRSAAGEIFNNPMSKFTASRSLTYAPYGITFSWGPTEPLPKAHRHCSNRYETSGDCLKGMFDVLPPLEHMPNLYDTDGRYLKDLAGTMARSNVAAPAFAGATVMAELRETMSFLRNPLEGFVRFLHKTRHQKNLSRKTRAIEVTEYIRDNWLSLRYAVRPMYYDIVGFFDAVRELEENGGRPKRFTARGVANDDAFASDTGPLSDSRYESTIETTSRRSVRAGILYEYDVSLNPYGFSRGDVAPAIWEAIPWSFVVDRFLNIGPFIQALSPQVGVKYLASWTTFTVEASTSRTSRWVSQPVGIYGSVPTITADGTITENYTSTTKTRTPGVGLGLALRPHPLENYSGELDVAWVTDLVSLIGQLLSRK